MNSLRLIATAWLATALLATAENRVLFIGNSFTQGGPVPTMFDRLAQAGGQDDPATVMRAVGGQDFQFHATDSETQAAIASAQWTHVVLQNYSTEPTHLDAAGHPLADHFTYGTQLYQQVLANNPNSQVILFETWSRAAAHSLITGDDETGYASTTSMQAELRENYNRLAADLNAAHPNNPPVLVAPVGDAWENAGGLLPASDPDFVSLHGSDDYHGNTNGYYLAAAVFYATIYNASPEGLSARPELASFNLTNPAHLERVAWDTVRNAGLATTTFHIDFGAADNTPAGWNNVTPTTTEIPSLTTTTGAASAASLTVTSPFNGANTSGTTASTILPAGATADSLFGNTELFSGQENIFPAFTLAGLDPAATYSLTFYASRTGVADNRQTRYTVTGTTTTTADLDPANNTDTTASTHAVRPDPSGQIAVALTPGPDNNNANHFTYLGALTLSGTLQTPLEFITPPADLSVSEFAPATFAATVRGTPPFTAQWSNPSGPVPDADALSFSIPSATASLDGTTYTLTVSDASGSQITSAPVTLTVVADTIPPTPLSTTASDAGSTLTVELSEPLAPGASTDPASYLVVAGDTIFPVTAATLSADATTLTLTLGAPLSGDFHVAISPSVTDLAANPVAPGSSISGTAPPITATTVLIDVGSSGNTTTGADDPPNTWNNLTQSVGASDNGVLPALLDSTGTPTAIRLEMLARFNGANTAGTTASTRFPASASGDSLFGNTETFSGLSDVFPSFKLTNLDPALTYTLTFYASRIAGDNRTTGYTIDAATQHFTSLDPAGNTDATATVENISPDTAGAITVSLAPTAANNNSNHFTYLGALVVTSAAPRPAPAAFTSTTTAGGDFVLDWTGQAFLDFADTPSGPWTAVVPPPTAPYSEPLSPLGTRFFRLRQ